MPPKPTTTKRPKRTLTRHARLDREAYLVDALGQLETLARDAAEGGKSFVAAVRAKERAIAVHAELVQLRQVQTQAAPVTLEEHRAEVQRAVRNLRIGAEAAGSFVAASKLLQLEEDMLETADIARRQAEAAELASLAETDIEAEVEAIVEGLPSELVDRLAVALADRRTH